ncbi:hypothetical protein EGW08_022453, partial [Elysia chlorotica]
TQSILAGKREMLEYMLVHCLEQGSIGWRQLGFLRREVRVKVGAVAGAFLQNHKRTTRLYLPRLQLLPVDVAIERLRVDWSRWASGHSKSFRRKIRFPPGSTDQTHHCGGLPRRAVRVARGVMEDGVEQIVLVIPMERRLTDEHFVEQDSERPPIHAGIVLVTFDDLNVIWSPAECAGFVFSKDLFFAHAKIRNLDVSIFVKHHVVQFQI